MSFTSSAGVGGPQAFQNAFDIPRIDQADAERPAQRAGGSTFSDLLNETIRKASQPAFHVGQTDAVQAGHALGADRTSAAGMSRGKIVSTGNPLHMAIEGEGSFVLTDGQRNVFTRTGSFAIDANSNLVDPATGYRVKRVGAEGEVDGFQTPGCSNIRIPYGMTMPAKATSEIAISGNLSADTTRFEMSTSSPESPSSIDITVYDSQGDKHVLSGAFIKTNVPHKWDLELTSATGDTGDTTMPNQRINGITFDPDNGSYAGLGNSQPAQFVVTFANDTFNPQTIRINLGTPGRLDGLTEFAGTSTVAVTNQNGYGPARLSTVSVNNEGAVVGMFSNGIKKNIAAVQITTFRDASALERVGNGYYIPSAGSGLPMAGRAMTNGAGAIRSGALEKSDSDVAADFANMIQAQGGNPANGILRDLTSFIR